jgi:hypothetical protein
MAGIAAHPNAEESSENAWNEALETLLLEKLKVAPSFGGIATSLMGVRMFVGSMNDRYAALAIFFHNGMPAAVQAVSRNPFKAILKTWGEVRNFRIYNPSPSSIPTYTKANRIMTNDQILRITLGRLKSNLVETSFLRQFQKQADTHVITYFTNEAS